MTALSGDERYQETIKDKGGKPKTMCEMIERLQAGLKEENAKLKKENADKDAKIISMVKAAMKNFNITATMAMDFLNIPEADRAWLMLRL